MSTPFHLDLDEDRGLLTLYGELDEPVTIELRETILKASHELTSDLAVDLAHVTFMPSPAIGVLAAAQTQARDQGATLTFVAPAGTVAGRLLTICALDHIESLD